MVRARAVNCPIGAALIFLGFCLVPETGLAASSGDTPDTVEKSIPQGKDPPGHQKEVIHQAAQGATLTSSRANVERHFANSGLRRAIKPAGNTAASSPWCI